MEKPILDISEPHPLIDARGAAVTLDISEPHGASSGAGGLGLHHLHHSTHPPTHPPWTHTRTQARLKWSNWSVCVCASPALPPQLTLDTHESASKKGTSAAAGETAANKTGEKIGQGEARHG